MGDEPTVVVRPEQPYVAIAGRVTMQTFGVVADRIPELFGWLAARQIAPVGAPFLRYNVIDMEREFEIEAGVPVAEVVKVADDEPGDLFAAVLPAGRYAAVRHVGHPDELVEVNRRLLDWAEHRGLRWDVSDTERGQRWGCRTETYETDPRVEADPHNWTIALAFRLAD